jgi:hypothetical protein
MILAIYKQEMAKRITNDQKRIYCGILNEFGADEIYRRTVGVSVLAIEKNDKIDLELLDRSDGFLNLFRQTADEDFFLISKALRRAAHKVYRQLIKKNKNKKIDNSFLNVIK